MGITDRICSRVRTSFIHVDAHNCAACWKCVESCPKQVLGKVRILSHHHVRVRNGAACIGCMKCVRVCQECCIRPNHPAGAV